MLVNELHMAVYSIYRLNLVQLWRGTADAKLKSQSGIVQDVLF